MGVQPPRPLEGRRIIVTGAAAGIGAATLAAVTAQGAHTFAVDIDEPGLTTIAAALGGTVVAHTADVTTPAGARRAVEHATRALGGVDGLVNVVGGSRPGKTIDDLDPDEWRSVTSFNLDTTYLMCHFAIAAIEQARGAIVNISSGAGVDGMPRNPAYCAAKAAVIGLTKALAIDHGPAGVRVNCVAPGAILTPLMERNRTPEEIAAFGQSSVLHRVGRAEEIANVVAFLLSDGASYVNGQTISINGG